jgi:hypothetical protein
MTKKQTISQRLDAIEEKLGMREIQPKWTKIGNLGWSKDIGEMDWEKACEKCKELGGRLPTRLELLDLLDNHRQEAEAMDDWYWSSTEYNSSYAWYVYFHDGDVTSANDKSFSFSVRCVRDIKPEENDD